MKDFINNYLLFLLFLIFCTNSFAQQVDKSGSKSEYKKAKNLIDSLNYWFSKDRDKYDFYAQQFNSIEFERLIDSNFRQVIFDRIELLRRNYEYEEAIPILTHSISIAKNKKDTLSVAYFYKMNSTHYYHLDNYDFANAQLDMAYTLYDYLNNKAELGIIAIRRARIEYNLGNYEKP